MKDEMTTKHKHDNPILVTGAAGAVGGIGHNLTEFLLAKGHKVRALVRREDERAEALRRLGAEVVEGDLTDLASMHRAIEGCGRIYFGMSVSPAYLEATINTAAVARHHRVEAFVHHRATGFDIQVAPSAAVGSATGSAGRLRVVAGSDEVNQAHWQLGQHAQPLRRARQ